MNAEFTNIVKAAITRPIDREEALYLFEHSQSDEAAEELFKAARLVREQEYGNVFMASGGIATVLECNLKPLCAYCPYWREKGKKPLSVEEILKAVGYLFKYGVHDFHLSGGTTLGSEGKDILEIVRSIYQAGFTKARIDVNCGAAMSLATLREIKGYGVKMVRSVFETLNPAVFSAVKPGDNLAEKEAFAWRIGEAGLNLGTGILAGLSPNESKYRDYTDFLFKIKEFPHLTSLYVSKFVPFEGIALKGVEPCCAQEAARVIAVARLVLRRVDITGAQGWGGERGITPFWAGGGNSALVIHINRIPAYVQRLENDPSVTYEGDMEFRNRLEELQSYYAAQGARLERLG
ncbi:MAG: radical SAM protein [Bacillota bacterium]